VIRRSSRLHHGHEDVLILEGSDTDDTGRVFRAGDVHSMDAGGEHSFTIAPDEPRLAAEARVRELEAELARRARDEPR
jgi:anti-sigma factor ChrR (cupin superfamily)